MRIPSERNTASRSRAGAGEIEDGAGLVNMGSGACFELNRIGFEI